jgi:hypothetical protein
MGMCIVIDETGRGRGRQTVVFDPSTKKYFLVSSVNNDFANETYIFQCDVNGVVSNWSEVWDARPNDHDGVVSRLLNGEMTSLDFYFDEEDDE